MVYEEDRKYQKHSNGKDHLTLYYNVEEKFSNPLSNLEATWNNFKDFGSE